VHYANLYMYYQFFFSSRRRHTRSKRDWSSDVCSSDLWLPDAMEAPTPVSAYLHSATMVKAGIYLVARFTAIFAGIGLWFWLVAGVGILTMLWGSYTAIRQRDLKALLAYST